MELARAFLFSFAATLLFGVGMYAPRRSLLLGALFGAVGYGCISGFPPFWGRWGPCFSARWRWPYPGKPRPGCSGSPALCLFSRGVIPLVPGVGLYRTILTFVEGDTLSALSIGVETVLIAAIMAMTIGVSNVAVRVLAEKLQKRRREKP